MSAEARAKIAAAQRARWAKQKKLAKVPRNSLRHCALVGGPGCQSCAGPFLKGGTARLGLLLQLRFVAFFLDDLDDLLRLDLTVIERNRGGTP